MIRSLQVKNYVLIDSLEIEFPESLVIITGQTGAGKSILLGALSLLTGAKADASVISEGADSCVVEAEFSVADPSGQIRAILEDNEVEWCDGSLLIRRVVHSSGRSRSFVNDSPVSVGVLSELASYLVDIHSQHQSLLLTNRNWQLSALDHYAGNSNVLGSCALAWSRVQKLGRELSSAQDELARLSADADYNAAQFSQLESAHLQDGELESLEEEQVRLSNAEEIKSNLFDASSLLNPESDGAMPVSSALKEAQKMLERTARFVPELSELASRLESSRIEIEDIVSEIDARNSSVSLSQERLMAVEDRMSELYDLLKKHSCQTIAQLIEVRDRFGSALADSSSIEERIASLRSELDGASKEHLRLCSVLHESRAKAAPAFAASIQDSLRFLELDRAVFKVDLQSAAAGSTGSDSVLFRFSSNGTEAVDVAKCASGGEISRIMLSLKAMMARFSHMPSMVFDEIDTGVSGSAADKMGSMICSMGDYMQVFAITHLPQVAAKGKAHYVVSKSENTSGRMQSAIRKLSQEERVAEIARLLSGSAVTDAAIANAQELLNTER